MILGHFAVALAAKRVAPRTSLGTTVLAANLLDLVWPVLLLLGVERVRIVPGLMAASPFDFEHYPWSHSLLTAALAGAAAAALYWAARRDARGAAVVGALVPSHWLLDAVMHRPDLPLVPGTATRVGLGLWDSIPATLAIELALLALGVWVYLRATPPADRAGRWAFGTMVALLLLIFVGGFAGSAPPSPTAVAVVTLGLWLFVPWAYWVDRHRGAPIAPPRPPVSPRIRDSVDPERARILP